MAIKENVLPLAQDSGTGYIRTVSSGGESQRTAFDTVKGAITADMDEAIADEADAREAADDQLQTEIDGKVDKVTGKGLSQNDFTNALKSKLDGIEAGAEVNTIETVKVNGTALVPDANRAVNVPAPTVDSALSTTSTNPVQNKVITGAVNDLKEDIVQLGNEDFYFTEKFIANTVANCRLNENDGCYSTNANYKLVKYNVNAGDVVKVKSDDRFQFQSVATVTSAQPSNKIGMTYGAGEWICVVPEGATYLIVSTPNNSNAKAYNAYSNLELIDNNLHSVADLNLFSWKNGIMGYVLVDNGSATASNPSGYTDFIPVESNKEYCISEVFNTTIPEYSANVRIHEYNSAKEWIQMASKTVVQHGSDEALYQEAFFTTTANTKYVIVSCYIANAISDIKLYDNTYGGITAVDNVVRKFMNEQLSFNATEIFPITDLAWRSGSINSNTGAEYAANNVIRTGFIDLLDCKYLKCIFDSTDAQSEMRAFFYDNNKAYLSFKKSKEGSETVIWKPPTNAKYVRLIIADWYVSSVQLSLGDSIKYLGVIYNDLHDYIPEYYKSHLESKEEIIRGHEKTCSFNGDGFVFLTDPHYLASYFIDDNYAANSTNRNNSIPMILDIIKNTGVRFIAFGGDLLNDSNGVDEMMQSAHIFNARFKESKHRLLSMVGNHEYYTDLQDQTNARPTANELYGGFIKYNESAIIEKGPNNTYFFDDPVQKIRYFMISCDRDVLLTTAQIEWVLNKFASLPANYKLVVIGHAFLNPTVTEFRGDHIYIAQAMDSITAGTTYTYNGNTYDYSNLTNVEVVCILTGHSHVDGSITSAGGTLCIATTCDCWSRNAAVVEGQQVTVPRDTGTIDEQAFDVVQFDFDNKKIYCTRIGYGSDREFNY